jgi:hypothetical protein
MVWRAAWYLNLSEKSECHVQISKTEHETEILVDVGGKNIVDSDMAAEALRP